MAVTSFMDDPLGDILQRIHCFAKFNNFMHLFYSPIFRTVSTLSTYQQLWPWQVVLVLGISQFLPAAPPKSYSLSKVVTVYPKKYTSSFSRVTTIFDRFGKIQFNPIMKFNPLPQLLNDYNKAKRYIHNIILYFSPTKYFSKTATN